MSDLITNSRASCYLVCPMKHELAYNQGWRPARESHALHFGTAMHLVLEQLWKGVDLADVQWPEMRSPWDAVKLECLMAGYVRHWKLDRGDEFVVNEVEVQFDCPLLHYETLDEHPTYRMGGKLDVIMQGTSGHVIVDHKSTSDDIGPTSRYWDRLAMSSQMTQYFVGAESLGYHCASFMYDVVKKPTLQPRLATPATSRKYKKDGTLYANQREHDEDVGEYRVRLFEDIKERPDFYFARRVFQRDPHLLRDHLRDLWNIAPALSWPAFRNPDACRRYGDCEYLPICADGVRPEEHPEHYKKVDNVHQELEPVE